jgi:hypothetical protein
MVRTRRLVARSAGFLAVPLLLAGVAAWVAPPGPAVAAQAGVQEPRTIAAHSGDFTSVAATSSGQAWAVGNGQSLPIIQY